MLSTRIKFFWAFFGVATLALAQPPSPPAQPAKPASAKAAQTDAMFKYSITDAKAALRGGGEMRLSADDSIELAFGDTKAEVVDGGAELRLTAGEAIRVNLASNAGATTTQAEIRADGSSVINSKSKSGDQLYTITDAKDGSGKIEIFSGNVVRYVISIGADGELSLSTVAAPTNAPATSSAVPAVTKPTATTKPESEPTPPSPPTPLPGLIVTPNSPPPTP